MQMKLMMDWHLPKSLAFNLILFGTLLGCLGTTWADSKDVLDAGFHNPPQTARLHCYWWWLNGNTTEATITRDLEQMKAKGYGGLLLVDADGSNQFHNQGVAAGPMFGTPAWRKLFLHALSEAKRLDLEVSLNIMSGWNLGGPTVKSAEASKLLTFSRQIVTGPMMFNSKLGQPPEKQGFYGDIAVLAYPLHKGPALAGSANDGRNPIQLLKDKAAFDEIGRSMPITTPLLEDFPGQAEEEDSRLSEVQDVTSRMQGDELTWSVPAGTWEILRIGYTDSAARTSTSSGKWQGLAIDYMDRSALQAYWDQNVAPLISIARPYVGNTLRYLATDSWELGGTNWTKSFREEFQKRRGYDLLPYLPIINGRIVESRNVSNRFLNDFRKTIGDLIAENHYGAFAELAKREGLGIHPESGGPHGAPIDAMRTLSMSTFPQTEFWTKSNTHRVAERDRFFVKEAASVAHVYGNKIVAAEGMTSIGPQWEEEIWDNLKPTFDQAACSGFNLLFWHTFTSSPKEAGLPGQEYFAGSHLNPNVTWWNYAGPLVSYINRSQFLLQQGLPVADVIYYYGDQVPNFVQLQSSDPANVLPGYDYDVSNEDALVHRMSVKNGRIVLPDGMSYKVLALGDRPNISLPALRKIRELVEAGATVAGSKPQWTTGLIPHGDAEVNRIASELWGDCGEDGRSVHQFGRGYVYCGVTARKVLAAEKAVPDFEFKSPDAQAALDYVHRKTGNTDIYFVRNEQPEPVYAQVALRVAGKAPELWHPDTGAAKMQPLFSSANEGRTLIPLWLEPYGSVFIVLRNREEEHLTELWRDGMQVFPVVSGTTTVPEINIQTRAQGGWELLSSEPGNYTARSSQDARLNVRIQSEAAKDIDGVWRINFPEGWGAPAAVEFSKLTSWTESSDAGIRYFSGSATYSRRIEIPKEMLAPGHDLFLDLGQVKVIARVTLNGKDMGIVWKKPFRLALTGAVNPGWNDLQITVANLWPNRLIGDQQLPPEKRLTRTNITKFQADSPLLPSGLLGPVRLISTSRGDLRQTTKLERQSSDAGAQQ